MDVAKFDMSSWMLNDELRTKAKIKYELKQQEILLRQHFQDEVSLDESTNLKQSLETLIASYVAYLKYIDREIIKDELVLSVSTSAMAISSYKRVQVLVQSCLFDGLTENEYADISQILSLYRAIAAFFTSTFIRTDFNDTISTVLQDLLEVLVYSPMSQGWYSKFVLYIQYVLETPSHMNEIFLLPSMMLQRLSLMYTTDSGVQLFNALCYYRYRPENIISQGTDVLDDVKRHQLVLLHDACLTFRERLRAALLSKGEDVFKDYLLCDVSSLLEGIEVYESDSIRDVLLTALDSLQYSGLIQVRMSTTSIIAQMILAFKHRYNPQILLELLIISLKQWEELCASRNDYSYQDYLLAEIEPLTSDYCCDLYRSVTSKDTRYLLHILKAVTEGKALPGVPVIGLDARVLMKDIREKLLECINTLKLALAERYLFVAQFIERDDKKRMTLGKRNKAVLLWLISLTKNDEAANKSIKIDKLFNLLESCYLTE